MLDERTQEVSFMCYTSSRSTIKWWDPHTNKLKYCSSVKFDEHNNKFGKVWSPGSELTAGTNVSAHPTLKKKSHITLSSNMVYLKLL